MQGLQQVVLYALPELDGAVDTVVLGGLEGDEIRLDPERVTKLAARLAGWLRLRATPPAARRLALLLYGFPPNVGATRTALTLTLPPNPDPDPDPDPNQVGATGTAALLDVPATLDALVRARARIRVRVRVRVRERVR